nr:serine hydrolase domain-containing protein [Paludifilum halophilum]
MSVAVGLSLFIPLPVLGADSHPSGSAIEQKGEKKGSGRNAVIQEQQGKRFPWDQPGPASPVLHPGDPRSAGMVEESLDAIDPFIREKIQQERMPGAVVLIARSGSIVKHDAYGYAARYKDDRKTPLEQPVPMKKDTIFDLASISKIFTTTAAMKLYEQGKFKLDDPVTQYIPAFAQNGKEEVTIRQLMTHTSGFESWIPLYEMGENREDRLGIVFHHPLENDPGTTYTYSDLNMITLGALVEQLSGKRLDKFVKENITDPLGMEDTMYNPPDSLRDRIAATEYHPWTGRGLVWGEVHDENAWSLDGVAGHAGVFSTARDLGIFAHMMLQKGEYGGSRILKESTVDLLEKNQNEAFPGDDHGLGWELNQSWYMDALTAPHTMGHTGYTGTSIAVSRDNAAIAITLTNRVHPTRESPSPNPVRRRVARHTADAIPIRMLKGEKPWFSGYGDGLDRSLLSGKWDRQSDEKRILTFETWHRMESRGDSSPPDYGIVEGSDDGESWTPLSSSYTGSSEGWIRERVTLPRGVKFLRFRYHTDSYANGRGWYVKNPVIQAENGEDLPVTWSGEGWQKRGR